MDQNPLHKTVQLLRSIIPKGMTGTAIEKYDMVHLWDLGDLLRAEVDSIGLTTIHAELEAAFGAKFTPALLRCAILLRKAYARQDYLTLAKDTEISFGKLRELIRFINAADMTPAKFSELIRESSPMKYEDVLELCARLSRHYSPVFNEHGIDPLRVQEKLDEIIDFLRDQVYQDNKEFYSSFSKQFNDAVVLEIRRYLSGLQNEGVFEQQQAKIKGFLKKDLVTTQDERMNRIVVVINELKKLASSVMLRQKAREEIGSQLFGEVATLLKAVSSEQSRKEYIGSRKVVEAFFSRMSDSQ